MRHWDGWLCCLSCHADVPRELAQYVSRLLHAERRRRGTRKNSRALTCFRQAVLGLRWFRQNAEVTALARDHGVSRATGYRYLDEVIAVLADQAPDLHEALEQATRWVADVEPGSTHDLTAARKHVLGALYWAYSQLDLPTLADGGYEGAGIGVHPVQTNPPATRPSTSTPAPETLAAACAAAANADSPSSPAAGELTHFEHGLLT